MCNVSGLCVRQMAHSAGRALVAVRLYTHQFKQITCIANQPGFTLQSMVINIWLISPWTKWPIFSDAFSWMKRFVFWLKLYWSLFLRVQLTKSSIGSNNGLASNRRQAIIWTNADPVHWRIYAALGGDELMHGLSIPVLGLVITWQNENKSVHGENAHAAPNQAASNKLYGWCSMIPHGTW